MKPQSSANFAKSPWCGGRGDFHYLLTLDDYGYIKIVTSKPIASSNEDEVTMRGIKRVGNVFRWNPIRDAAFDETVRKANIEPIKVRYSHLTLWLYKEFLYEVSPAFEENEIKLLVLEEFDKERKLFERLKKKFEAVSDEQKTYIRERIPESVRVEVWRRDSGKCARCGRRENLEYDHIIPVSKGGSNTARNIELLCEICNRSKGAKIE